MAKNKTNIPASAPALASVTTPVLYRQEADLTSFKRLSAPPIIKPDSIPVGAFIVATLTAIVSVTKPGKGEKAGRTFDTMHLAIGGTLYAMQLCRTIRSAFGDNPKEFVGKEIVLRRLPDKKSLEYGREYTVWEVWCA